MEFLQFIIRSAFIVYVVHQSLCHRPVQRHDRFLVTLTVDLEFPAGKIERRYIQLLQFKKPETVSNKQKQDRLVTLLRLVPVLTFLRCQVVTALHGIQHDHHLVILQRFDLPFAGLWNPYRIESVGDIFLHDPFPVQLFEHDRKGRFLPRQRPAAVLIKNVLPILFHPVFPAVIQKFIDVRCFYFIKLCFFYVCRIRCLRQIRLFDEISTEKVDISQVCESCFRQNISFEITKKAL